MNQTTIDVHLSSGLKTIAQTSMEVADTFIMLAKSHPDFQKWSISVKISRDQCRKWLYAYKKFAVKFGVPRNE